MAMSPWPKAVVPKRLVKRSLRWSGTSLPPTVNGPVHPRRMAPSVGERNVTSKPFETPADEPRSVTETGEDDIAVTNASNVFHRDASPTWLIHTLFAPPGATRSNGFVSPLVNVWAGSCVRHCVGRQDHRAT